MDPDRWKITDIDVPFKCMVWWLFKLVAAYGVIAFLGFCTWGVFLLIMLALGARHLPH